MKTRKTSACPLCGTPVRAHRNIYTCDTGRSCGFLVYGKIANRKISKRSQRAAERGSDTDRKGFKSQRTGREFSAALKLVQGKVKLIFESNRPATVAPTANATSTNAPTTPVGMICPTCGQGRIIRGRAAWGCNRYREGCRFVLPFETEGNRHTEQSAAQAITELQR